MNPAGSGDTGGGPGGRGPGGPGGRGPGGAGGFMRMDTDGDGKISREEAPDRLRERFDEMDKNGDGFLDASDFQAMSQPSPPQP